MGTEMLRVKLKEELKQELRETSDKLGLTMSEIVRNGTVKEIRDLEGS